MTNIKLGLCQGRHEIPGVTEHIFPNTIDDVTDVKGLEEHAYLYIKNVAEDKDTNIDLYVTGLTVALVAVINACTLLSDVTLTLWHFNNATGEYYSQIVR